MSLDAKKDFQKDPQKLALIPADEHIQAVIRAVPQEQMAGAMRSAEMQLGAAGALAGAAARKISAQGGSEVAGGLSERWPLEAVSYWIVLTDSYLRVFRTTKDQPKVLDPADAAFAFNEIERVEIGQSFAVKPMKFFFTDGSAVTIAVGAGTKIDDFVAAARRAFSGGVTQGLKDTSGLWYMAWLGIFGLMLGALATGVGATTESGTSSTILSIIAAGCAALATWWWIVRWRRSGWRSWGVALTLLILGAILTGASFDTESCDCGGMIWVGATFALIGLIALGGRLFRRS